MNIGEILPILLVSTLILSFQAIIISNNVEAQNIPPPSFLLNGNNKSDDNTTESLPLIKSNSSTPQLSNVTTRTQQIFNSSDLRVYENRFYGIFIQYPATWRASTHGLTDYTKLIAFYSPLENLSEILPATFTIGTKVFLQNISLPEYSDFALRLINNEGVRVINENESSLGGHPAYKVVFSYTTPIQNGTITFYSTQVWSTIGNIVYYISYDGEKSIYNAHLPEVNLMMKSLRIGNR